MSEYFYHSGKLGDIIYSIPTIHAMRQDKGRYGTLITGMSEKETEAIKPLLTLPNFPFSDVVHNLGHQFPRSFTVNLDKFRLHPNLGKKHLVDVHAEMQGVAPAASWRQGWVELPPILHGLMREHYAVVSVTSRYRDPIFNWKWEIAYLRRRVKKIYFIGLWSEYNRSPFADSPHVEYLQTWNLMEAATYINNAAYFSGNQSSALAIRQAVGRPYRFEQSPNHWDVRQDSEHETVINRHTRRIFLTALCIKKALRGKQA